MDIYVCVGDNLEYHLVVEHSNGTTPILSSVIHRATIYTVAKSNNLPERRSPKISLDTIHYFHKHFILNTPSLIPLNASNEFQECRYPLNISIHIRYHSLNLPWIFNTIFILDTIHLKYPLNTHEIPVMSPRTTSLAWAKGRSPARHLRRSHRGRGSAMGEIWVKSPRIQQLDCLSYCLSNCLEVQGFIPAQIWQTIWPLFGGFFHTQIWPGWFWPVLGGQCQLTHCQQVPGRQSQSSFFGWYFSNKGFPTR